MECDPQECAIGICILTVEEKQLWIQPTVRDNHPEIKTFIRKWL